MTMFDRYDRVAHQEVIVSLAAIGFDAVRPGTFSVVDDETGSVRQIPLHRVRTVYKDGAAIWRRPAPVTGQ